MSLSCNSTFFLMQKPFIICRRRHAVGGEKLKPKVRFVFLVIKVPAHFELHDVHIERLLVKHRVIARVQVNIPMKPQIRPRHCRFGL